MPFPINPADIVREAVVASCKLVKERHPATTDTLIVTDLGPVWQLNPGLGQPVNMRLVLDSTTIGWLTREVRTIPPRPVTDLDPAVVEESITQFRADDAISTTDFAPGDGTDDAISWLFSFHGPLTLAPSASAMADRITHVEPGYGTARLYRATATGNPDARLYWIGFQISTAAITHPLWTVIADP